MTIFPNNHNSPADYSEGDINLSSAREQWITRDIGDQTRHWLQRDSQVFLHQSLSTPCLNLLTGCEGVRIHDLEGRAFLDFHGNNVHQIGYGHPKVKEAILRQMDLLSFCPRRYTNIPAILLAEKLVSLTSSRLGKVLFAPGGALAVGMALKLARMATGRHKTISMWDSFHGASLDAISISGESIFRQDMGPLLSGAHLVPPPDCYRCLWKQRPESCQLECAAYIEYVLAKERDIAAVISETVRSNSMAPPPGFWKKVRAACDRYGTLLILDEIPLGLGRTGKMFVFDHYGIVPDMVVLGKGLGGGIMPLAALIARSDLDIAADRAIGHYTHEKNPVACAAGLATIEVIETEGLVPRAEELGTHALGTIRAMQSETPSIGEVRGLGLLLGIDLVKDRFSKVPDPVLAEKTLYQSFRRGLSYKVTHGNILTLTPPLTIQQNDLDIGLNIIQDILSMESETRTT